MNENFGNGSNQNSQFCVNWNYGYQNQDIGHYNQLPANQCVTPGQAMKNMNNNQVPANTNNNSVNASTPGHDQQGNVKSEKKVTMKL